VLYRWPTDPAGKPAAHKISWAQHNAPKASINTPDSPVKPFPTKGIPAPGGSGLLTPPTKGAGIAAPAGGVAVPTPTPATYDPFQTQPGDSASTISEVGDAQKWWNLQDAAFTGQLTEGERRLGVTGTDVVGADGVTGRQYALNLDNPYSRAAQLKVQFEQGRNGMIRGAGNNVFSGSQGALLRDATMREGKANDDLINDARDFYQGIQLNRGTAYDTALGRTTTSRRNDASERAADVRALPPKWEVGDPAPAKGTPTPVKAPKSFSSSDVAKTKAFVKAAKAKKKASIK
jgi:hypothetical protein